MAMCFVQPDSGHLNLMTLQVLCGHGFPEPGHLGSREWILQPEQFWPQTQEARSKTHITPGQGGDSTAKICDLVPEPELLPSDSEHSVTSYPLRNQHEHVLRTGDSKIVLQGHDALAVTSTCFRKHRFAGLGRSWAHPMRLPARQRRTMAKPGRPTPKTPPDDDALRSSVGPRFHPNSQALFRRAVKG